MGLQCDTLVHDAFTSTISGNCTGDVLAGQAPVHSWVAASDTKTQSNLVHKHERHQSQAQEGFASGSDSQSFDELLINLDARRTQQQQRTEMLMKQRTEHTVQSQEQQKQEEHPLQQANEGPQITAPSTAEWGVEEGGDFDESDDDDEDEAARLRRRKKLRERMLASQAASKTAKPAVIVLVLIHRCFYCAFLLFRPTWSWNAAG